jgi:hypothetical protein
MLLTAKALFDVNAVTIGQQVKVTVFPKSDSPDSTDAPVDTEPSTDAPATPETTSSDSAKKAATGGALAAGATLAMLG